MQDVLKNVVERGTGKSLYDPDFSMAGKTGTAQTEYWKEGWAKNPQYISSFVGFFPAEEPKYSCIVVIHKPHSKIGYYGADVSGPVFKRIAQKIFTDSPVVDEFESLEQLNPEIINSYEKYYTMAREDKQLMPDLKGLPGMDAISLLENLGLQVKFSGTGEVVQQSIKAGEEIKPNQTVNLQLS